MDNYNLLPDNEVREVDNRRYINPNLAVNETNTFIDNYRNNQRANTQEIASQTQALGTNVPSNIGGLTGAGSYFTSRYQTPQTNAVTQNLRTVAQQTALNEALANEQAMWKKRYQDAYNRYQKRQNDKTNPSGGGGGGQQKLSLDVNSDDEDNKVDLFEEKPGTVIPMTPTSSKYQDPKTGQWFMLTSPTDFDGRVISNSLAGRNPVDGMTLSANGKVFRYDGGSDMWYQQVYLFGQG